MKPFIKSLIALLLFCITQNLHAQGPPITGDKPIMLGAKRIVLKTLSEYRVMENGDYLHAPFMIHYLPTSSTLLGLHVPLIWSDSYDENNRSNGQGLSLGDIQLLGKYQFWRRDGMGKTLRFVAKTFNSIPTGKELNFPGIIQGKFQSFNGLVLGYESIKYGISNELGYNYIQDSEHDELRYKLGFGLPLKKPSYPVDQINLYFEYQSGWFVTLDDYYMLYAQGIQYAKGRVTVEASVQFPLIQELPEIEKRKFSVIFGTRFVI